MRQSPARLASHPPLRKAPRRKAFRHMSVTVYHYPRCSTCKKALAWLATRGVSVTTVDLVETPPSAKVLGEILEKSGVPPAKLWNTSGELYRAGNYRDQVPSMTKSEALRELSTHGKLIKRPLILGPNFALVGFREAEYEAAFPARKGGSTG